MNETQTKSKHIDNLRLFINNQMEVADKKQLYYASQQNKSNIKMASPANNRLQQQQQPEQVALQRKLLTFLYVYAILIVSLYLTYAAYYFYQQHQFSLIKSKASASASQNPEQAQELKAQQPEDNKNKELETKMHLLERYIELIAIDLQETKSRLKEREKCDCSIGCNFNGTRFEDKSSWQNQCDICTCKSGSISCSPKKCPQIQCDDYVTLPGQCCPTCMRKCKYNNSFIRHGQKFNPGQKEQQQSNQAPKVCQCLNGRIKCEPGKEPSNLIDSQSNPPSRREISSSSQVSMTTKTNITQSANKKDQGYQISDLVDNIAKL